MRIWRTKAYSERNDWKEKPVEYKISLTTHEVVEFYHLMQNVMDGVCPVESHQESAKKLSELMMGGWHTQ